MRMRLIFMSKLNAINRIAAINSLVVPVTKHGMNIIKWQMNDIKKLNTKRMKVLTIHRMHHPKADVDRPYLPRSKGERELIQIELTYKMKTAGLETYLRESKNNTMKLVLEHERKKLHSVAKKLLNSVKS